MSETVPTPANNQQPQPPAEALLSIEHTLNTNEWDFGGANEASQVTAYHDADTENRPLFAPLKVKLAVGIGRLASIGMTDKAPDAKLSSQQTEPGQSWEYRAPEIVELHKTQVEGIEYFSNLPEGIFLFKPIKEDDVFRHPAERPLLPSTIDTLPAGTYFVAQANSRTPGVADTNFDRKIVITDEPDGKRINEINKYTLIKNSGKSEALMTALGYQFDELVLDAGTDTKITRYGELKNVPTPETLRNKAAELGVNIRFFPDQGLIDSETYLQAFADETFPISTADAAYYAHDTQDDHLTAMVLGGAPLKAALRDTAKKELGSKDHLVDISEGIDEFTSRLRATVAHTLNDTGNHYSPDKLRTFGESIGISANIVDEILETAQASARKFGMDVTKYSEA